MTPDLAAAAAHIDALARPGGVQELRTIASDGTGRTRQFWRDHDHRRELIPIAVAASAAGRHVYLGVLPRPAIGASGNKCIALAQCVFVDFDGKHLNTADDAGQRAEIVRRIADACLPEPSMLVCSGHGWHCYWFFDEPLADMDRWANLIDSFIATLRSDAACSNEERIMRWAGFPNWKAPAAMATLDYCDTTRRYAVADLEQAFSHGNLPEQHEAEHIDAARALSVSTRQTTLADTGHEGRVISVFLDRIDVADQLRAFGYTIVGGHFRRPGKADRGFSGIIRADKRGVTCSAHWSENDPLNDRRFGGRAGRPGTCGVHDAFSAYAHLEHGGDVSNAVKAAAKLLGVTLPPHRRDGDILRAIQSTDDADEFARLMFGEVEATRGACQVRMAEIIRRHTSNPRQVERLLALATSPAAKGAA